MKTEQSILLEKIKEDLESEAQRYNREYDELIESIDKSLRFMKISIISVTSIISILSIITIWHYLK